MGYATIQEAWGGVSGSNMLGLPVHPKHKKRLREAREAREARETRETRNNNNNMYPSGIPYKTNQDLYRCTYGPSNQKESCGDIVQRNTEFNEKQKQVAIGLPPNGNQFGVKEHPYQTTYLPQYPWYPNARYNYLAYGPEVSHAFYGNPWNYDPQVAQQINDYQMKNPQQYIVPIGPYKPVGFFPGYFQDPVVPQPRSPQKGFYNPNSYTDRRVEHFSAEGFKGITTIRNLTIFFIFFLIVIAIVFCIFLIAFANTVRK